MLLLRFCLYSQCFGFLYLPIFPLFFSNKEENSIIIINIVKTTIDDFASTKINKVIIDATINISEKK